MATLYPYISEGARAGQPAQMKIHALVWIPDGVTWQISNRRCCTIGTRQSLGHPGLTHLV